MHKRRVNQLTLELAIEPAGPLLIKSGQESGADPTLPSMNFVRTQHPAGGERTVYLPGASFKGVMRSHSERIIRTVLEGDVKHCCDTLHPDDNCSSRIQRQAISDTAAQYRELCLHCRIFGHMVQGSHFFAADAYPAAPINDLEQRHGVAIDRLSGGVAFGPFDMEVVLEGAFATTIRLLNFELWQLGLLALTLRDLDQGQVRIGFGKSRGFGEVRLDLRRLAIAYPAQYDDAAQPFRTEMLGVGRLAPDLVDDYDYVGAGDALPYPDGVAVTLEDADWGQPTAIVSGREDILAVLRAAVPAWAAKSRAVKGA